MGAASGAFGGAVMKLLRKLGLDKLCAKLGRGKCGLLQQAVAEGVGYATNALVQNATGEN